MAAVQTTSIDFAAWGFLRHRFVRALLASGVVLVVFGLLTAIAVGAADLRDDWSLDLFIAVPIAIAIVLLLFLAPIFLLVGAVSAIVDTVHPRLIALFAAAGAAWLIWFCAQVLIWYALVDRSDLAILAFAATFAEWQLWMITALMIATIIVALEAILWAVWQIVVPRETFLAARGWRPPLWRLFSTFRRRLGLPAYLAGISRGRLRLSLLYFLEAVLNAGLLGALLIPLYLLNRNVAPGDMSFLFGSVAILAALFLLNLVGLGRLIVSIADRQTTALYQSVREWDARAPVVFLRDFDQDKARLRAASLDPVPKILAGVGARRTMDELLLEHASPYGPVIAIGDPRNRAPPLGAARIFVQGNDLGWQNVVTSLVAASRAIVMCPTTSRGVRWELELLDSGGVAARTIYLANPALSPMETASLFAAAAPNGEQGDIRKGQVPIAAYADPKRGWRVITARRQSVQTTTIALNLALQALLGHEGEPLRRRGA